MCLFEHPSAFSDFPSALCSLCCCLFEDVIAPHRLFLTSGNQPNRTMAVCTLSCRYHDVGPISTYPDPTRSAAPQPNPNPQFNPTPTDVEYQSLTISAELAARDRCVLKCFPLLVDYITQTLQVHHAMHKETPSDCCERAKKTSIF